MKNTDDDESLEAAMKGTKLELWFLEPTSGPQLRADTCSCCDYLPTVVCVKYSIATS